MAMNYLNFDLLIESISNTPNNYRCRVDSPAGEVSSEFIFSFSAEDVENLFLSLGQARHTVRSVESPEMKAAQAFGATLFKTVFVDKIYSCLMRSLDIAHQHAQGLRIRLHLTHAPDLCNLPWEFLYNPTDNLFFAPSNVTPIIRYLDLPRPTTALEVQWPLQILVMIANPRDLDYSQLDSDKEWHKIKESLADLEQRKLVNVVRLKSATLSALQHELRLSKYHIFHFVGHGSFSQQNQTGMLILEDEQRRTRFVNGDKFGALLRDHSSLRLVLLNACEGARSSHSDPLTGVAQHLGQQGIPAVIAMQFAITDQAAITLSQEFYRAIADNYPVDAALSEARKALFTHRDNIEWGTPVLFLRTHSAQIFTIPSVQQSLPATQAKIVTPLAKKFTNLISKILQPKILVSCIILLLIFVNLWPKVNLLDIVQRWNATGSDLTPALTDKAELLEPLTSTIAVPFTPIPFTTSWLTIPCPRGGKLASLNQVVLFPEASTNWSGNNAKVQKISQFNISIGELMAIDVTGKGSFTSQIKVEYTGNSISTSTESADAPQAGAIITGFMNLSGLGLSLDIIPSTIEKNFRFPSFDGVVDYAGLSGQDFGSQTSMASNHIILTEPGILQAYSGDGLIPITAVAIARSQACCGNISTMIRTQATANLSIIYHYCPKLQSD